jgi:hypothetical protein
MEVFLYTSTGQLVAKQDILPFNAYPEVILWGYRTFTHSGDGNYNEAFTFVIPSNPLAFTIRSANPQELREKLGKELWQECNKHAICDDTIRNLVDWEQVPEKSKETHRQLAEAVLEAGINSFAGEVFQDENGKNYRFNLYT